MQLLRAVGEVAWVDDEGLIDAVTAVSGSGPAYVFHLAECLAAAGVKAGLAPELAQTLARCTVAGSGELLHRSDLGADVLRQNVTSPGGTTFAALQVLMAEKGGLAELMREAVAAATRRSRELAKSWLGRANGGDANRWPGADPPTPRVAWIPVCPRPPACRRRRGRAPG